MNQHSLRASTDVDGTDESDKFIENKSKGDSRASALEAHGLTQVPVHTGDKDPP